MKKTKPRILFWDIETSHNVMASFELFPKFIPYENILQEWYIICAAWKLQGQKRVSQVSVLGDPKRFKKNPNDDYHVVKTLHEVLSNVDVIVHHYGDNFDIKKFNTRAVFHGFTPLPPIIQIDTFKIAKQKFKFNTNRLDYIGRFLGLGNKIKTENELWLECLSGNAKAVKDMVRYNKQDVYLLERVYDKLSPFVPAKLNQNLFSDVNCCPSCSSTRFKKSGYANLRIGKYQAFRCNDCGHYFRSGTRIDNERYPLPR